MRKVHQRGFTIAELLIAVAISLTVFAGAMTFYVATVGISAESLQTARLNQYLRAAMDLMVSDIRRAGYWAGDIDSHPTNPYQLRTGSNPNPFMSPEYNLSIGKRSEETIENSCILYSYDLNKNGHVGVGSDDSKTSNMELFGFRLNGKKIQMRKGGDSLSCDGNYWDWEAISDEIDVTNLTFFLDDDSSLAIDADASLGTETITIRKVTISVTGNLLNDQGMTRTIKETVRIRNDKF